jgi:hypothetical protein
MQAAYDLETNDRLAGLGVADKWQFGAESLYPKMGFTLNPLLPYFAGTRNLKPGWVCRKPIQRYVRIAWANASDVADEVAKLAGAEKPAPAIRSLTGEAVCLIEGVGVDAGDRSPVLDARQLGAAGARNVYGAEGPTGIDEAVGIAGGVGVEACDLPGVVDAECGRTDRERKVDGVEHAGLEQEAVGCRRIRPSSDDVAGGVDPCGQGADCPREVDRREGAPLLTNPCSTLAASK